MNNEIESFDDKKQKKTSDMKAYMREYMRNRYYKNAKQGCNERKTYYYKKKYNLSNEEVKKYGSHLHLVIKTKKLIEEMKIHCPEFLEDII